MTHKTGVLGVPASYHQEAAIAMEIDNEQLEYFSSFTGMFDALEAGTVNDLVVAIANNRVQFIPETYPRIFRFDPTNPDDMAYRIVGEGYVRVDHSLQAPEGAKIENIQEVHTHSAAMAQCTKFLERFLPEVERVEERDTASSAQHVAKLNDPTKAAIASLAAGELYGLKPIAYGIQDDKDNITRFLRVVRKGDEVYTEDADKTTLLIATPEGPGSLHEVLGHFAVNYVDLAALHSRIIPNSAFAADFLIELNAGITDERANRALESLMKSKLGVTVQILGSYCAAEIPINMVEQHD